MYIFINPEDYGFWMAVFSYALFTRSLYNLAIALEFIILMIPHMHVENIPLKRSKLTASSKRKNYRNKSL